MHLRLVSTRRLCFRAYGTGSLSALHVASVGYWAMFGLNILFGVIFGGSKSREDHFRWKGVLKMLDACVPEEKRAGVQEELERGADIGIWIDAGSMVFGQVVAIH